MDGLSVRTFDWKNGDVLVLGNEGQGVHVDFLKSTSTFISVPGANRDKMESLNVAVSGAVILHEFFTSE